MVAQRAQWYETPWFPLGSLPSLVKNSFTISWRLEAEDEGRSIGDAVCERRPSTAALLFDDSPRSQLGIRTLIRSLKRLWGESNTQSTPRERKRKSERVERSMRLYSSSLGELDLRSMILGGAALILDHIIQRNAEPLE